MLIVLFGVVGIWLAQESEKRLPAHKQAAPSGPDFYISRFSATEMNRNGRPWQRLEAESLVHYADSDTTELTRPYAILFSPGNADWHLSADKGLIEERGELIHLTGNVLVKHLQHKGEQAVELRTNKMRVWPEDSYAETDDPVAITSDGSRVNAIGMRAYFEEERVELLSAVRGYYDVQ